MRKPSRKPGVSTRRHALSRGIRVNRCRHRSPTPSSTSCSRRSPSLAGRPRQLQELSGGLTNRNVKVTTADGVYVARCTDTATNMLGIDRDREYHNTKAAAEAGVGAQVIDYRPDLGILLLSYLEGQTLSNDDFQRPEILDKAAAAVRALHSGPRFQGRFDMFERQPAYLKTVMDNGFRLPDDYLDHADTFDEIARVLRATDQTTVPCNNDLLAGNFIEDGDRMWLIDYEYSGNNDPCFELGNTWCEMRHVHRPTRRIRHRLLRAAAAPQDRARPPAGNRRQVRLDTVGLHTKRFQRNRIRLLGMGDGTL